VIPRTQPGPELWLGVIAEGETVGTELSAGDRNKLVAIAVQAFRVRALQRAYFKTRSNDILTESKAAERELDALLIAPAQGGFF